MKYSPEKKAAAVARMSEIGVQKTSEEMNISVQTLYKWRNEEGAPAADALKAPRKSKTVADTDDLKQLIVNDKFLEKKITALEAENAALRDENKELRLANEKMKKAIIALLG